jgi:hypothetical protein
LIRSSCVPRPSWTSRRAPGSERGAEAGSLPGENLASVAVAAEALPSGCKAAREAPPERISKTPVPNNARDPAAQYHEGDFIVAP